MRFIDDFIDYHREFTGCPTNFLTWSALSALSAVANYDHYMPAGRRNIRMNIWTLLLARSSTYKSTGIDTTSDILREIMPDQMGFDEFSHASLVRHLAKDVKTSGFRQPWEKEGHRVFIYDEAEQFFRQSDERWNQGMRPFLMKMFGGLSHTKEINGSNGMGQRYDIVDPYVVWCGASTIDQISRYMNGNTSGILSGFFPRFLFIPQTDEPRPFSIQPPHDIQKYIAIRNRLSYLRERAGGTYTYTPEAREAFDKWFHRMTTNANRKDPLYAAFFLKMRDIHIHKIAMLCAFERESFSVSLEDFAQAVSWAYTIEKGWSDLIPKFMENEFDRKASKVLEFIRSNENVGRQDIYREFRDVRSKELKEMIDGWRRDEIVHEESMTTGGRKKMVIFYLPPLPSQKISV